MQEGYVFPKEDSKRYSSSKAMGKIITNAFKKSSFNYSPHSLRRYAAQKLVFFHKVALPLVAEFLGHRPDNIQTLMTSYCLIPKNESINAIRGLKGFQDSS